MRVKVKLRDGCNANFYLYTLRLSLIIPYWTTEPQLSLNYKKSRLQGYLKNRDAPHIFNCLSLNSPLPITICQESLTSSLTDIPTMSHNAATTASTFFDDEDRHTYLQLLWKYADKFSLHIWAYCLMDNHVHLLVAPEKENSLVRSIGLTNQVYTQYLNRKLKQSGRVWQNRFFPVLSRITNTSRPWRRAILKTIRWNPALRTSLKITAGQVLKPLLPGRKTIYCISRRGWISLR